MKKLVWRVVRGAFAGAVANWVMGKVTTVLYEREDPDAREREDEVRHGRTAMEVAAEKVAGVAGKDLDRASRGRLASALHQAVGIGAGVVYALTMGRRRRRRVWDGLAFGTGFFLLVDEGVNTAFGFTPPPRAFPWQAHARGLAGHLVFGATTDAVLRATGRLARA